MKKILCFFNAIALVWVTILVGSTGVQQSSQAQKIALKDIDLDLTLLEPVEVRDQTYLFLKDPIVRLNHLVKTVGRGFNKVTFRMTRVAPFRGQELSPFMCLPYPFTGAEGSKNLLLESSIFAIDNMAKAAAITPYFLEKYEPDYARSTSRGRVVRAVVMFAETLNFGSPSQKFFLEEPKGAFPADGSGTCEHGPPQPKTLKKIYEDTQSTLILVTPDADTVKKWQNAFESRENVFLYPDSDLLVELYAKTYIYDGSADKMVSFLRSRVIQLARDRFPEYVPGPGDTPVLMASTVLAGDTPVLMASTVLATPTTTLTPQPSATPPLTATPTSPSITAPKSAAASPLQSWLLFPIGILIWIASNA